MNIVRNTEEILSNRQKSIIQSSCWTVPKMLNQGFSGACVGYAWAHLLVAEPLLLHDITDRTAKEVIYWNAQKLDDREGGEYPGSELLSFGTSVLAGAKAVRKAGYIIDYVLLSSFEETIRFLKDKGPLVFGCSWFDGMRKPDPETGYVTPTGSLSGKHTVLLNEVHIIRCSRGWVNDKQSWVNFVNSFGPIGGSMEQPKYVLEI
ncbi:hypothetical protein VT98_10533 [Candidatus Electrothrix communis]|uniref:Papain family cysteine protease n=1 Tax=Candidatus Electrothrix communis TaxID=1859133 RepID=A0A444J8P7_9BACT|nr:hypothetical protein VT98_10533 [Candidatus Electrothrix communis]